MSWDAVDSWLTRLAERDPAEFDTGLSPEGARLAWEWALGALSREALALARAHSASPWDRATIIAARTVFTGPLEWCALLLGRGSAVLLKHPRGVGGSAHAMAEEAAAVGLPLQTTDQRSVPPDTDFLLAMGTDHTMDTLRSTLGAGVAATLLGHRFSAAFCPVGQTDWSGVAMDVALHDSRGCLSPVVVFTDDVGAAMEGLTQGMHHAQSRVPRGFVSPAEHAAIRAREALARVAGQVAVEPEWSVHVLPPHLWQPVALPRSLAVVEVANRQEALQRLAPFAHQLSTVGAPTLDGSWHGARITSHGTMQRPPIDRVHDGFSLIHITAKP